MKGLQGALSKGGKRNQHKMESDGRYGEACEVLFEEKEKLSAHYRGRGRKPTEQRTRHSREEGKGRCQWNGKLNKQKNLRFHKHMISVKWMITSKAMQSGSTSWLSRMRSRIIFVVLFHGFNSSLYYKKKT